MKVEGFYKENKKHELGLFRKSMELNVLLYHFIKVSLKSECLCVTDRSQVQATSKQSRL